MTRPCNCATKPIISSLELRPGARAVHVEDARGTWHAIEVDGRVSRQVLVAPSEAELARRAADAAEAAAQAQRVTISPMRALAMTLLELAGEDSAPPEARAIARAIVRELAEAEAE